MDAVALKAYAEEQLEGVLQLMEETLSSDIALLDSVNRSVLDSGGKRIRPLLTLLSARACGKETPDTRKLAAVSELMHNATLLHDDVVDEAPTRRGKPTVTAILNAPASVLIGDYWLARALCVILSTESDTQTYLRLFAQTLDDLAQGEILQLQKTERCDTTFEDYIRIVGYKTASLFESSARAGAHSAGASPREEDAIGLYARYLGIAFQIKDDTLDYVGGDIGKPQGQDLTEQKVTMPLLSALEKVPSDRQQAVRGMLASGGKEKEILAFVREMDGVSGAQAVLESYVEKACEALAPLPDSPAKRYLTELARYSSIRQQ